MMRQRLPLVVVSLPAVVLFLLAAGAPCALANSVTYALSVPSITISGKPSPFATVTVDLTSSSTARITFQALTTGGQGYLLIGGSVADVNVNATNWTIGGFSEINPPGLPATLPTSGGSGNVYGFGVFNQTNSNSGGFVASEVAFTLTDTAGTWASAASVLTPNAKGYLAASHIAMWNFYAVGFAANDVLKVPEASAITLTSLVLIAFGATLVRARRRQLM
jgi:hypothetical protein